MSNLEAANLFNVKGLVAVITGGGSGIGLLMTKALALNGAHKIYIIGRRKEVLDAAAKESPHGNIIPFVGDVTSKEDLQSIVSRIEKEVGYINVLIANSGIAGPQATSITPESSLEEYQSALWNQSSDEYTKTFNVNVTAVFFSIVAFLKLLDAGNKKQNVEQKSQVIATSSIGGFNRKVPGGYAYGQSKAGTTLLMKHMATNLVPYDIRSNVIAPGRKSILVFLTGQPEWKRYRLTRNSVPIRHGSGTNWRWCLSERENTCPEIGYSGGYGWRYPVLDEPRWCLLQWERGSHRRGKIEPHACCLLIKALN